MIPPDVYVIPYQLPNGKGGTLTIPANHQGLRMVKDHVMRVMPDARVDWSAVPKDRA